MSSASTFSARCLVVLLVLVALLPAAFAAAPLEGRAEVRVIRIDRPTPLDVLQLSRLGFDLERDGAGAWIAYVTREQLDKLDALGLAWTAQPDPGLEAFAREQAQGLAPAAAYHTYDTLTSELQQVATDHPAIARRESAGKTVQGREMWWMHITNAPDVAHDRPAFKYLSTMHGDEVVGMENCIKLIHWLTDRYATDARVKRLVDNVDIWIMPLVNPDGNALHQRGNANGVDLNRDFPDLFSDPVNTPDGRQVETANLMRWQTTHWTNMSANFHGGALVVNYPYDNTPDGGSYYSTSPDDDTFRDVSLDYSEDNGPMYNGSFPQGITNGADWYSIDGGMQDWNYHWYGDMETTIELSNTKWPSETTLDQYWNENRESMLSYMERVLTGVRGVVTDAVTHGPVAARLHVHGRSEGFPADPAVGDYHRPLLLGSFSLDVEADGYAPRNVPFTTGAPRSDAVRVDVALDPLPTRLEYAASRLVDDSSGNGVLDPGESGHLAVTLKNAGARATQVTGSLRAIDPYAGAGAGASWPDLAPGASAESLAPHCALAASASTPAGHRLAYVLDWAADGASGTTAPFFVPTGAPTTRDNPATDVPRPIPDNSVTTSTLPIADDREIAEVNVRVDITHTYVGDLRVTLLAPDGTAVRLHDRGGGSADDIHTWYDTQTKPVDDLVVLNGRSSAGTWSLRVEDLAGGDTGTLTGWTLQLVTRPWESPVPEVGGVLAARIDGATRLTWWPVGSATTYRVYRSHDPRAASNFSDATPEDATPSDTQFDDHTADVPGQATFFLVTGMGHTGEGRWGHYGR